MIDKPPINQNNKEISPEILEAQKKFIKLLSDDKWIYLAIKMKDNFNLTPEFIQEQAQKEFINHLSRGYINSAIKIKNEFNLTPELVQELVQKGFINCLSNGIINDVIEIKNEFNLTPELVQELAQKGFINNLSNGIIDRAIKIKDRFNLNPQKVFLELDNNFNNEFNLIKEKFPKLYDFLSKSIELQVYIVEIIKENKFQKLENIVTDNPFLEQALENNTRYGSKLFLKWGEFDKRSKENIKTLFDFKEEILKENKDIDVDSAEFRILMQEKLREYRNNANIVSEMEKRGINSDNFLNYKNESFFTLGEEENVSFSEKIKTPITRIKETLNKYQEVLNNTVGEYKKELQSFKIDNPEKEKIIEQIKYLENKINEEKDERKLVGMKKGLESLKLKLESLKQVDIWSRVQSDLFRLKSMIENIFKYHDLCVSIEGKLPEIKDRKELLKEKVKLEQNIEQLKSNFKDFESFFGEYKNKLKVLLIPSLGNDRAESILQEMKENLGEEFNHYETDKNDINKLFSGGENEKEGKLDGTDMKIYVSSRNPDLDLYLGNYCPCCICIDSEYHGEESPISDYVTDLGIQNIVIYDEKREVPVMACWTFIGENEENGEPILVIDNIEANTQYTNNYSGKLKKEIKKYITEYAKSSGIKNIIQGPHNNDLVVFNTGEVSRKLGGIYNRKDGYFLEAENDEED